MNNDRNPVLSAARADGAGTLSRPNLSERVRSLRLPEGQSSGGRGTPGGFLPWALCVVLALTSAVFGLKAYRAPAADAGGSQAADASDKAPAGATAPKAGANLPAAGVSPTPAAPGEVVLEAKGYVIPVHQILVSPKINGMIVWLHDQFEEGRRVEKGTVLARLESDDYDYDVKRAQAGVAASERRLAELEKGWPLERMQAEARLASAKTNMEFRRRERDRAMRSGAAASRKEIDEAESLHEQAVRSYDEAVKAVELLGDAGPRPARIAQAKAEVEQSKADLSKALWRLKQTEIVAPVTGTILSKKAEKGNLVNPVAFTGSTALCEMADLSDLEVDLSIQERDIATVSVGQECTVMPEAFMRNAEFLARYKGGYRARVSRLMPIADRSKGAIPVRVRIDKSQIPPNEEGRYLKPEMGVIVSFKKVG